MKNTFKNFIPLFNLSKKDVWIVLTVSCLWTLLVIQFGLTYGKLSMEVGFDDSIYMNWGYSELRKLYGNGDILNALKNILQAHSPWASFQALSSFAIFGPHDWAPYIFNGFIFSLFILLVWYRARASSLVLGFCLLFWVLSLNLSYLAISEFRPDFFNALMAGIGGFLMVSASRLDDRDRRSALYLSSICFALAFFIKPTFFANSIFIWGSSALFFLLSSVYVEAQENFRDVVRQRFRELLIPSVVIVLLSAPVFLLKFEYYLNYLWVNSFGADASIWRIDGGFKGALDFYLSGWGSQWALGKAALSIWIVIGMRILWVIIRGDKRSRLQCVGEIWITLSALTVIVVGRQSAPFFGLTFAVALTFTGVSSVVYLIQQLPGRLIKLVLVLPLLIFAGLYNSTHYNTSTPPRPSIIDKRDSIVQKITQDILQDSGNEPSMTFIGFVGNINGAALQWVAQKEKLHQRYHAFDRTENLQDYISWIDQADYVVTAEQGAPELMYYLPTVRECHVPFHEYMLQNNAFELLSVYETYNGKNYYLFKGIKLHRNHN